MAYTLTDNEAKLPRAILYLKKLPDVKGRCLGYCRQALESIGLKLPPPQSPHSTALACYVELTRDPAKYGWVRVETPEAHPILLQFFSHCGEEIADNGDHITAGHVALKLGDTLYSSKDYLDGPYWHVRLCGSFIPL